ncbi:MAG: DNA polymerase, partial [Nitrososphaerales archaeon]
MDKDVVIPLYLKDGIKPLSNHFPKKPNLLVFDTETENGEPYLLIFYDGSKITYLKVNKDNVLKTFLNYLNERCHKNKSNILFAHNLLFDMSAILCKYETDIFSWRQPPRQDIYDEDKFLGSIRIFYEKQCFAQIKLGNGAYVKAVDSSNFIRGSLYDLSRALQFKYKKRRRPYFVEEGRAPKTRKEWQKLYLYCNDEIKAEYELAKYILEIHKKYDVGYSVSQAQLGSKIFRKHFLKDPISQIPEHIRKSVELTIHGGRANVFVDTPITIPNVRMYDYNSFYPYAMTQIPPITKGEWIKVEYKHPINELSEYEGFYKVTGYAEKCKYPIIIKSSSSLDFANGEEIKDVWVTSYELREAIRNNEIEIKKLEGYLWKPRKDATNPFKDYVEHFYSEKSKSKKNSPLYLANKLLLNALYGKTYQALRQTDYAEEPELIWNEELQKCIKNKILYRAGGLYLPHVGSWITSLCRAKLHEDLHKYQAIDCATDSFKTLREIEEGSKLGDLKLECEGLLLLIRPKLYVIFTKEIQ